MLEAIINIIPKNITNLFEGQFKTDNSTPIIDNDIPKPKISSGTLSLKVRCADKYIVSTIKLINRITKNKIIQYY